MRTYFTDPGLAAGVFIRYANEYLRESEDAQEENARRHALTSVLLAFMALETYINGYAAEFVVEDMLKPQAQRCEKGILDFLHDEHGRLSLDNKLLVWPKIITGMTFDTSSDVWGQYKWAKKLRDRLTHLKLEAVDQATLQKELPGFVAGVSSPLWGSQAFEEITPSNARKVLAAIDQAILMLTKFRGWPPPYWVG